MDVLSAGLNLFRSASQRLDSAANGAAHDPTDPKNVVDAKVATDEGAVAAKLIRAGDKLTGELLDILV